ncbi:thiol-disulfide oxidoreductase DCC family protein [Paenibacillus tarimensis]
MKDNEKAVVLFDGVCNFCNSSVQFIIKRDSKRRFQFASLQSEAARRMLNDHHAPPSDSVVLIESGQVYVKSTAALRICRHLDGFWKYCSVFLAVPWGLRDIVYNFIAKNRYRWFGKRDSCMLPTPEQRSRFLE